MLYAPDLWGSQLIWHDFDVLTHNLRLRLSLLVDEASSLHEIACTGVTRIEFRSAISPPWTYAEVTELCIDSAADGQVVLDVMLWSEDAGITVTCASIERALLIGG